MEGYAVPAPAPGALGIEVPPVVEDRWVQCDKCEKWRRVTDENADVSQDKWYCFMNTWDPLHASCEAVEEPSSPDAVAAAAAQQQQWAQMPMQQQQQLQQQQWQQTPQQRLSNPFAAVASQPHKGAPASKGKGKKKKRRGSDDDSEEDTSATNSADEAFYASIDGAGSSARRSGRATRPSAAATDGSYMDFDGDDGESGRTPGKRKQHGGPRMAAIPWSQNADDALLSAIVKHGLGNWTQMLKDPEFSERFEGHKATHLRNRWRKLGTSEFNASSAKPEERKMAAKRETVFEHIAASTPPTITAQATQQSSSSSSARAAAPTHAAGGGAGMALQPPQEPFVAYRPYPSHIFDLPRKAVVKKAVQSGTAADAQLSTPMDMGPVAKKKRGRKPLVPRENEEEVLYSDEDSDEDSDVQGGGETGAEAAASSKNEFADLEENLDNIAYMHYYDHRNDSLLLYDTYAIPMRELKRQLAVQYAMKNQDALELIKALSDAPDLYTRRNMMAKAIHAHLTHFQAAQQVRQWLMAMRTMSTQALHRQHDIKLRMDQQSVAALKAAGLAPEDDESPTATKRKKSVAPAPAPAPAHVVPLMQPSFIAPQFVQPPTSPHAALASGGKTPAMLVLAQLPYYWRKKLEDLKLKGLPCPTVAGPGPHKAELQDQLATIAAEWDSPALVAQVLKSSHHHGHGGSTPSKAHGSGTAPSTPPAMSAAEAAAALQAQAQTTAMLAAAQRIQAEISEVQAQQQQQLAQLQSVATQMSAEQYQEAFNAITTHAAQKLAQLQAQQAANAAATAPLVQLLPSVSNIFLRKMPGGGYQWQPHSRHGVGRSATSSRKRARSAASSAMESDDDDEYSSAISGRSAGPKIRLRKAGVGLFTLVSPHAMSDA